MKKFHFFLLGMLCCSLGFAGTLIYKTDQGEKRASKVKILSIDNKRMIIQVNEGTKTMALSRIVKYYDTDISISEFDDNSADYTIRLGEAKISADKKKGGSQTFTITYDITRKPNQNKKAAMRVPYLYLFVLASNGEGGRGMTAYSFPASARASLKNYDEAKMLEKVISLKRPEFHESDATRLGRKSARNTAMGGARTATFVLNNLKNRKVIAWYVVAWNKGTIAATKEHVEDSSYTVNKNWWIR